MSFGIIRVRKLSSGGSISNSEIHNARQYEERGLLLPDNIQPDKKGEFGTNSHTVYENGEHSKNSVFSVIEKKFEETGVKPRKDSVLALEYVVALSPDCKTAYEERYQVDTMLERLADFVAEKHGEENLISISKHYDESNPHAHVIVTPIVKKEKKWKNRNGEGVKLQYALSARDFTGGREKLRGLQTDFYNYVKGFESRLGVEFFRGVDARKSLRKYSRETIKEFGDEREKLRAMEKESGKTRAKEIFAEKQGKDSFKRFDPFNEKKEKRKPSEAPFTKKKEKRKPSPAQLPNSTLKNQKGRGI